MKGWLRLGILFLIIASGIVVVNASAKSTNPCGGTIYLGQTVDISSCVSTGDTIAYWANPSQKGKTAPSTSFTFSEVFLPQSFYVSEFTQTGTYYLLDTSTFAAVDKVFKIEAPK